MTSPAYVHFFLLIMVKMSSTLVYSLIHDVFLLSLHIMPNTIIFILLWALWGFYSRPFVRLQISDPYVTTGKMYWLYTFLLSDSGRNFFISLCSLPQVLHPILIFFFFILDLEMHTFFEYVFLDTLLYQKFICLFSWFMSTFFSIEKLVYHRQ